MFVAISLPDALKDRLAELLKELRGCGAKVRWVDPASLHLTLKFLGQVKPDELGSIDQALGRVASAAAPTWGELRGVGSFPHLRRPRVIWVGLEPVDDHLGRLQVGVEEELAPLGFALEKRRFHAHITVGRLKGQGGVRVLAEMVEAKEAEEYGRLEIGELTLYESRLSPRGARYTTLGTYRLGAPE